MKRRWHGHLGPTLAWVLIPRGGAEVSIRRRLLPAVSGPSRNVRNVRWRSVNLSINLERGSQSGEVGRAEHDPIARGDVDQIEREVVVAKGVSLLPRARRIGNTAVRAVLEARETSPRAGGHGRPAGARDARDLATRRRSMTRSGAAATGSRARCGSARRVLRTSRSRGCARRPRDATARRARNAAPAPRSPRAGCPASSVR